MGYIYFRLSNAANLQGMAPPALPGGGFGVAALPGGMDGVPGMYIIINCSGAVENRYIGISSDIGTRFRTRMATVTELDIDAATLATIHVVWGRVKVRNHPAPGGPPPGPPAWTATTLVGGRRERAGSHLVGRRLDGGDPRRRAHPVYSRDRREDRESRTRAHSLRHDSMTQLLAGGTVSNNQLMVPFTNPVGIGIQPLTVKFHSAAFGPYPSFTWASVLNPGGVPW